MPRTQPIVSKDRIREFAEWFTWFDPKTNQRHKGYNPPKHAVDVQRVPFHMKAVILDGSIMEGDVITLEVNTGLHMRNVQFVNSGESRWVYDMFIIEIDGVRFR